MRELALAVDRYLEDVLSVALYAYIIIAVFWEVLARYVLNASVIWAEETAIYAFIWLSYVSMAKLARTRSHLAFTAVRDAAPPAIKLALLLLADVALLVLSTIVLIYIYEPIADSIIFDQKMVGVDLPLWLATAAVPFGWALLTWRVIQRSLESIRQYRSGEEMTTGLVALD